MATGGCIDDHTVTDGVRPAYPMMVQVVLLMQLGCRFGVALDLQEAAATQRDALALARGGAPHYTVGGVKVGSLRVVLDDLVLVLVFDVAGALVSRVF